MTPVHRYLWIPCRQHHKLFNTCPLALTPEPRRHTEVTPAQSFLSRVQTRHRLPANPISDTRSTIGSAIPRVKCQGEGFRSVVWPQATLLLPPCMGLATRLGTTTFAPSRPVRQESQTFRTGPEGCPTGRHSYLGNSLSKESKIDLPMRAEMACLSKTPVHGTEATDILSIRS
jgi:hypothetical protein